MNNIGYQDDTIFLLSIEEYEKYKNEIPFIKCCWWLRSSGDIREYAAYVRAYSKVDDYGGFVDIDTTGVRPALKYSNLKSKISKSKKGEDYFIFNDICWKIIDRKNEIAISELPIGFERFDYESNDYENSYIRKWLLDWMK